MHKKFSHILHKYHGLGELKIYLRLCFPRNSPNLCRFCSSVKGFILQLVAYVWIHESQQEVQPSKTFVMQIKIMLDRSSYLPKNGESSLQTSN
jgi:hypothetical protein